MSFSVPKGVPVPASLRNIYKELADEFPGQFKAPTHGNLESWARQGVLLLNACLTVRSGQAASHHGKGWEPFTRSILKLVAEQAGKAGEIKPQGTASGESSSVASTKPEKRQATLMSAFKKASKGKEGSEVTKPKEEDAKAPSSQAKTEVQAAAAAESRGCRGVVFLAWGQPAAKTLAEAGITEVSPHSPTRRTYTPLTPRIHPVPFAESPHPRKHPTSSSSARPTLRPCRHTVASWGMDTSSARMLGWRMRRGTGLEVGSGGGSFEVLRCGGRTGLVWSNGSPSHSATPTPGLRLLLSSSMFQDEMSTRRR